jgi:hypothetical protein
MRLIGEGSGEVVPGRYCETQHPTHSELSFLESNGIGIGIL